MARSAENVRYGGIGLIRSFCDQCDGMAFVKAGSFQCCGQLVDELKVTRTVREGPGKVGKNPGGRKIPVKERLRILRNQNWLCIYCLLPFQFAEIRDTKRKAYRILRVTWDHFTPWVYAQSNHVDFVAACQICNGIKSSSLFNSMEEARSYISEKWKARYEICRILEGSPVCNAESPFSPEEPPSDSAESVVAKPSTPIEPERPSSNTPTQKPKGPPQPRVMGPKTCVLCAKLYIPTGYNQARCATCRLRGY